MIFFQIIDSPVGPLLLAASDAGLRASAWRTLAELAEARGDDAAAAEAWKKAALSR